MVSTILVNQYNFPAPAPSDYNDPLDWTLIQAWDTGAGDMTAIDTAFGGFPRGSTGVIWSLDGSIITLGSTSNDTVRSFSCSTPWDPDTATLIATRGVTNPTHMFANKAGTIIWYIRATDTYVEIPVSNFTITGSAEGSTMNKADAGFSGSSDVSIYPVDDFSSMIIDGPPTDFKRIDFSPAGDLDSRALGTEYDIGGQSVPWTQNGGIGGSKISKDGTRIYRGAGSQGVEILEMTTPFDESTLKSLGTFDNEVEVTFRPDSVWVNPEDTTEVWIQGDNTGMQLARMATNV